MYAAHPRSRLRGRPTRRSWLVLAFLAFMLRAVVPGGYMLQASAHGVLTMTLCPAGSGVPALAAGAPSLHAASSAAQISGDAHALEHTHVSEHGHVPEHAHVSEHGHVPEHAALSNDATALEARHTPHDTDASQASDCAFGALAAPVVFPAAVHVAPAGVGALRRLTFIAYAAAPPLPAAGPPLGSRAPPQDLV